MTQQPTMMATAYQIHEPYFILTGPTNKQGFELGKVVRITSKYIWIDETSRVSSEYKHLANVRKFQKQPKTATYKERPYGRNTIETVIWFEPNPLEEFISHGITMEVL